MKKIIYALVFVILSLSVIAISENDILTQEQINSLNYVSVDLKPSLISLNILSGYYVLTYQHYDIKKMTSTYSVNTVSGKIKIRESFVIECIDSYGRAFCIEELNSMVNSIIRGNMQKTRDKIRSFQQVSYTLYFWDFFLDQIPIVQ